MPADASAAEATLSRQRRIGLRVALAVAAGFTWNLATGEVIPFFGPVLAVQFLIFGAGPLPLSKAVAFVGLVLVVGQAFIVLNGIFGDHPIQLLALLGLFYFRMLLRTGAGTRWPCNLPLLGDRDHGYPARSRARHARLKHNCNIAPSLPERRGLVVARPCDLARPRCDRERRRRRPRPPTGLPCGLSPMRLSCSVP